MSILHPFTETDPDVISAGYTAYYQARGALGILNHAEPDARAQELMTEGEGLFRLASRHDINLGFSEGVDSSALQDVVSWAARASAYVDQLKARASDETLDRLGGTSSLVFVEEDVSSAAVEAGTEELKVQAEKIGTALQDVGKGALGGLSALGTVLKYWWIIALLALFFWLYLVS